uniref:CCHC-type domain-containing protein n=1 Tax=Panagrolaimus davidi TaxID=227884 RepID=A0A914QWH2_9BILA
MMERKLENEELSYFIDRFEKMVKQATSGLTDAEVKRKLFEEFMLKLDPELAFHVRMAEPADYSRALEAARKTEVLLKLKKMDNAKATIATVQVEPNIDYEELASRIADMLQNDNQQSPEPPAMSHEEEQTDGINIERLADLVAERLGLMEEEDEFYDEEEEEQNEPEGYYRDSPDQYPYGPKLCYYCNQPGHIQRNCYVKMRDEGNLYPDQINAVEVSRLELENELEMLKAENHRLGENIRKGRLQKPQ